MAQGGNMLYNVKNYGRNKFNMRGLKEKYHTFEQSIEADYKKYKKIATKKGGHVVVFSYKIWEKGVIENLEGYCIEYLENVIYYLKIKNKKVAWTKENAISILLPFFIFIMGIYFGVLPIIKSLPEDLNSSIMTLYDTRINTLDEEMNAFQIKALKELKADYAKKIPEKYIKIYQVVIGFFLAIVIGSFLVFGVLTVTFSRKANRVFFYETYIEIIQGVISDKKLRKES